MDNATHWLGGVAIQWACSVAVGLFYARVYHPRFPAVLKSRVDLGPLQYLGFAFYFPFGVVCGMFSRMVKASPTQLKSALLWLVLLFV